MKTENHNEDSSGNEMLGPEVLAVREPTDEEDLNENLHPYLPKAPNLYANWARDHQPETPDSESSEQVFYCARHLSTRGASLSRWRTRLLSACRRP